MVTDSGTIHCSSSSRIWRIFHAWQCKFQCLHLKLKCNAKTTLHHFIVWNSCGTMPKFQWKNRLTFRDIYVQSWQNHSFPIIFWKHTQGLAPSCGVTHDTGDNFFGSSILSFSSSLHKNVCLWEQSDFEMESYILLHEYQPFDRVLQFGNVRYDVTSENFRQMYESTPFCLVNNKALDLGKYCEFDRKLIGYVSFIHSAIWTKIVLPLHFYFLNMISTCVGSWPGYEQTAFCNSLSICSWI